MGAPPLQDPPAGTRTRVRHLNIQVIASRGGGGAEGFYTRLVNALARALQHVLTDTALARQCADAGAECVRERHSEDAICAAYQALYQQLSESR